jgi:hypothetical protein
VRVVWFCSEQGSGQADWRCIAQQSGIAAMTSH